MVLVDSLRLIEAFRRKGRLEVKLALESLLDAYEAPWCLRCVRSAGGSARLGTRETWPAFPVVPYRLAPGKIGIGRPRPGNSATTGSPCPADVVIAALALHDDVRLYGRSTPILADRRTHRLELYTPGALALFVPDGEGGGKRSSSLLGFKGRRSEDHPEQARGNTEIQASAAQPGGRARANEMKRIVTAPLDRFWETVRCRASRYLR